MIAYTEGYAPQGIIKQGISVGRKLDNSCIGSHECLATPGKACRAPGTGEPEVMLKVVDSLGALSGHAWTPAGKTRGLQGLRPADRW